MQAKRAKILKSFKIILTMARPWPKMKLLPRVGLVLKINMKIEELIVKKNKGKNE